MSEDCGLSEVGMTLYERFADRFGRDNAAAIVAAAKGHSNGIHDRLGSDPFKWALCICIGYECFTRKEFADYHGITANAGEVKAWIKEHADLASHDGDVDYLAVFAGVYNEYLPEGQTPVVGGEP